ncbi:muramidase [Fusarium subglutinans]|uniref:Muramidase n=1 Tax=Gibberella subglutinans TaxID=42677 RepID=A0A8H5L7F0_GIBSU|nr:muramidase [Fusarium subglutinans]KAF5587789.1 muramidase [Fusarium subglutinans]
MRRLWSWSALIAWATLPSVYGEGLFSLGEIDGSMLNGASDACVAAINTKVSCPFILGQLYFDWDMDLDTAQIKELCQGSCLGSLADLRDSVKTTCGSEVTYEDRVDGALWKPSYLMEQAIYYVERACLRKGNGQYCNTWFQSAPADASLCDECYKLILWHNAQSPLSEDTADQKAIYASASSSCGYKKQPTQTYQPLIVSSPTATISCSSEYTIKSGDTFLSVSKSQKVSTHDLATANRLDSLVSDFPSSGKLCIRNQCDVYVVKSGDTCESIQSDTGLSRAKLRSWNPFINGYCDNVSSYVNQTICISNPLGDYKVPENEDSAGFDTPATVPDNIAPDTKTNCGLFHNVTAGDDCGTIGLKYSISLDDLIFLNPMIWQNCTNLWLRTSYCVAPVGDIADYLGYGPEEDEWTIEPQESTEVPYWEKFPRDGPYVPLANGTREDCWEYLWWNETYAGSPIPCLDAALGYELDLEQFFLWNPSLDQNEPDAVSPTYDFPCTISPFVSYCMQLASPTPVPKKPRVPPSPRAAGEIANCTRWFMGYFDCASQLGHSRMTMEKMYRYNPSLKEDCSGYTLGTFYCHETIEDLYGYDEGPAPTTSSTPTSTTSSKASSSAAQPTDVSTDGTCGGTKGKTCLGSAFGDCCSSSGYCGDSSPYCGGGCQSKFGKCDAGSEKISPDGTCGGEKGYTCEGSQFGNCCSQYGYCGTATDNCGNGCQKQYGLCN